MSDTNNPLQANETQGVTNGARLQTGFLREQPELRSVGFDLESGQVSRSKRNALFGEWEEPEGLAGDDDLAVLRSLHLRAVEEWQGMAQTLQAVASDPDPALNDAGRLKSAARVLKPRLDQLEQVAQAQVAKVDATIAEEIHEIEAALRPSDPAAAALYSDIRAYWKSESARGNSPAARLVTGDIDDDTLAAIATAPPYLSGITQSLHDRARHLLAQRLTPDKVRRVEALRLGKARAMHALSSLQQTAQRLVDFDKAAALAAKERSYG